jgi:DNA-3-methyladenine glycosylase I
VGFDVFAPVVVAGSGDDDVARLLADPGIVRNRAKVEATVANARAVVALHEQGQSLVEVVFSHAPGNDERRPGRFRAFAEVPSVTPASTALAKDLRARGFRFVGPTVAYSLMQAAGVVDDHLEGCWVDVLAEN